MTARTAIRQECELTAPAVAARVLVVEDDPDIGALVSMHLADNGFEVRLEDRGDRGLEACRSGSYDLVVLDLVLPGVDGLSFCRHLREDRNYVPILMLTAKSTELDRVLGLEMGADDYLTKPFSVPELMARVKALLRRVEVMTRREEAMEAAPVINWKGLSIDPDTRQVHLHGEEIVLTAREFELLHHLARHPGRVYSRTQLLDEVWGYSYEGYEHTVNTHINRLRAKIEADPANPALIQTVWGVGYKFVG